MSGMLGALGPISQTPDEIAIVIGGNRIVGWESASITRSVEAFPNSFTVTAADQFPDDATKATVFPSGPGEKCQIFIGSDLILTGYVDRYAINIGGGRHDVTIAGRGICEDLVDCSADLRNNPAVTGGTITASNALDLAQKLCGAQKIAARLGSGVTDPGKPINALTVALGETPYEIIERVARYSQFLVYEDENGALVLDHVGTDSMASGFTMPGNIEGASSTLSFDQRFSQYIIVWNSVAQYSEVNPLTNQSAIAVDETMPPSRPRVRIIVSEQYDPSLDLAQARANWEKARRIGRSQAINLTCDSWRDTSGTLWQPNKLAPINASALKILNASWIIGTVTFRKDASGTHADLVLMPPDAFSPEPAPLYLWDREIMHSTQGQGAASLPPQDGVS